METLAPRTAANSLRPALEGTQEVVDAVNLVLVAMAGPEADRCLEAAASKDTMQVSQLLQELRSVGDQGAQQAGRPLQGQQAGITGQPASVNSQ